jgi:hypothetical protein
MHSPVTSEEHIERKSLERLLVLEQRCVTWRRPYAGNYDMQVGFKQMNIGWSAQSSDQ